VTHYRERPEVILHIKSRAGDIAFRTLPWGCGRLDGIWHNWYAVSNEDACPAMVGDGISKDIHHALEDVEEPKASQLKKFNNINKSGVAQMWRTTPKPRLVRYEAVDIMGEVIPGTAINILKKLHPDPRLRTWGDGQRRQNKRFELYRYN